MNCIALQVCSIWEVHERIEERLGNCYCSDDERYGRQGGLEAMQGDIGGAEEDAQRSNISEGEDGKADLEQVEGTRADHGGRCCWSAGLGEEWKSAAGASMPVADNTIRRGQALFYKDLFPDSLDTKKIVHAQPFVEACVACVALVLTIRKGR